MIFWTGQRAVEMILIPKKVPKLYWNTWSKRKYWGLSFTYIKNIMGAFYKIIEWPEKLTLTSRLIVFVELLSKKIFFQAEHKMRSCKHVDNIPTMRFIPSQSWISCFTYDVCTLLLISLRPLNMSSTAVHFDSLSHALHKTSLSRLRCGTDGALVPVWLALRAIRLITS